MSEISIITTDQKFVEDLNSAGIEGVRAQYQPTLAFDSAEHILQIVVEVSASAGLKLLADFMFRRYKKDPPTQMTINNYTINNAETIVNIVNNTVGAPGRDKVE